MSVWAGYDLELETKVHEDFTTMENAPKREGLSLLKAPIRAFTFKNLFIQLNIVSRCEIGFKNLC